MSTESETMRDFFTLPKLLLTTFVHVDYIGIGFARSVPRDDAIHSWHLMEGVFNPANQVLWDPATGPSYKDVSQGSTGACWLDALIAAVAYADQNPLKKSMNDPHNSKGTVTVTLWDREEATSNTVTKKTINTIKDLYSDAQKEEWL